MNRIPLSVVAGLLCAAPLAAQHQHAADAHASPSAYAALLAREIKALSNEDIAGLMAADGMGLALAAELNGFPGPKHVLELGHALGLQHETVVRVTAVRDSMLAAATALGAQLVEAERRLDRAFAAAGVDATALRAMTAEIARLHGDLRFEHLRAHLAVRALLTAEQTERYEVLRGYAAARSN